MSTFHIASASGSGGLTFFERTPEDPTRPLERYKARVVEQDLAAIARVYDDGGPAPDDLFARMAASWRGWAGELAWESAEGELSLAAAQDRAGHVALRIALRSGPSAADWEVRATIQLEAGQLEELARRASAFFRPIP